MLYESYQNREREKDAKISEMHENIDHDKHSTAYRNKWNQRTKRNWRRGSFP